LKTKIESLPFGPIVANAEIVPKYKGMQDVNVTKTLLVLYKYSTWQLFLLVNSLLMVYEQVVKTTFLPFTLVISLQR